MANALGPIPAGVPIVEPEDGTISDFFRLRWEQLVSSSQEVGTKGTSLSIGQAAAIVTTAVLTVIGAGLYRISYYMRKTAADGVASSLTFTYGWVESGVPLTEAAAALVTDTTAAQQSGSKLVRADANTDITFSVAYASNTPGAMQFRIDVAVEALT